jgi:adenine-specific DNA-methyltransferase
MAKRKAAANGKKPAKRPIEQYAHTDKKRPNNPPVGLVTPSTDPPETARKTYAYDPHLDPQLVWAGKAERTSFEVPTVSLHVHERIDPKTIIEAVKTNGTGHAGTGRMIQGSLFDQPTENPPLREAIDFYKHPHGWSNRLIAGDSLLVMNSLLEKEGMAGKVQMVYIDPPYGIRYGSNFQPFVNRRDVKDGKDEDLTQEPETLKAFRDTWELGIHSYLTYFRDRVLLAKELLHETGSCFVQISDENLDLVKSVLAEIFGATNLFAIIPFKTKIPLRTSGLAGICDYLIWFAKDISRVKFRKLYTARESGEGTEFTFVELSDGTRRKLLENEKLRAGELPAGARLFRRLDLSSAGQTASCVFPVEFEGNVFHPTTGKSWKTNPQGMQRLLALRRVIQLGSKLYYVLFYDDYPVMEMANIWNDTAGGFTDVKRYAVETNPVVVRRCMLMSTDPGDLVFDPTCGSGTTAQVAEEWGRRWITCDTSRVAVALTRQRMTTALFDYYCLAKPDEGVRSGLRYKRVPHITLGQIAQDQPGGFEDLYDKPEADSSMVRVTGPFTVEAVPAPTVLPIDDIKEPPASDASVARSGVTLRQDEWRDEMAKTGVRAQGGKRVEFVRLEPLAGARYLHAIGETKNGNSKRVAVSFGPEHSPLEQRQVELAWEEARGLSPRPEIVVFAAFHFDPEAAKDIDELDPKKTGMTFLRSQMNTDLLTEDLKKKRSSNESFWLIGQPDVDLRRVKNGEDKGRWQVEIRGFDYYNPTTGQIESGDSSRIAMWLLDTDYDGRSLLPRQVFFPMAGPKDGWARLAKSLKAEIDEDKIEAYRGTTSLPFEPGKHKRIAVKIVDDRGIESLKLVEL